MLCHSHVHTDIQDWNCGEEKAQGCLSARHTGVDGFSLGCQSPSQESFCFLFKSRLSCPTADPLGPSKSGLATGGAFVGVLGVSLPPKANLGPLSALFRSVNFGF